MATLSLEFIEKIFDHLSIEEKVRCELVCKDWFNILHHFSKNGSSFRVTQITSGEETIAVGHMDISLENTQSSSFRHMKCENIEHALQYFSKCPSFRNMKSITFKKVNFINPRSTMRLLSKCFPNLEELVFDYCNKVPDNLPMSSLFDIGTLKRLNIATDKMLYFSSPFLNDCNGLAPLTHLKLQCPGITSGRAGRTCEEALVALCRKFGSCLDHVCLDVGGYAFVADLFDCISHLPRLKNLTFGPNVWRSTDWMQKNYLLLNQPFGGGLKCLEYFSTTLNEKMSIEFFSLLRRVCKNPKLRYLNLSCSPYVDFTVIPAFNARERGNSPLTVFAYGTKLSKDFNADDGSWVVRTESLPPDGMFFGFTSD